MNKAELEKKPLSDLHLLAAEAGVERYRMLSKSELVEKLAEGNGNGPAKGGTADRGDRGAEEGERSERPRRRRRSRRTGSPAVADEIEEGGGSENEAGEKPRERRDRPEKAREREPAPEPVAPTPEPVAPTPDPAGAEGARPRRR